MMKKVAFLIFWGIYFLASIINNLIIEEQARKSFFYNDKSEGTVSSTVNHFPVIGENFRLYSEYSGAETGFGLYAPNVSSQVVVFFKIKNENGETVKMIQPSYDNKEINLRMFSVYDLFIEKIPNPEKEANPDEVNDKFLDALLKSIAFKVLNENKPYRKIEADVYLYFLPFMPEYQNGGTPIHKKIYHSEYEFPVSE